MIYQDKAETGALDFDIPKIIVSRDNEDSGVLGVMKRRFPEGQFYGSIGCSKELETSANGVERSSGEKWREGALSTIGRLVAQSVRRCALGAMNSEQ
jgi:hypothetical protein